eukprot:835015_1
MAALQLSEEKSPLRKEKTDSTQFKASTDDSLYQYDDLWADSTNKYVYEYFSTDNADNMVILNFLVSISIIIIQIIFYIGFWVSVYKRHNFQPGEGKQIDYITFLAISFFMVSYLWA